jgi:hypothetical protein
MRLAMRVLFVLALPGIVFAWLTRLPPPVFEPFDSGFPAPEVGWLEVLATLFQPALVAGAVTLVVVVLAGSFRRATR